MGQYASLSSLVLCCTLLLCHLSHLQVATVFASQTSNVYIIYMGETKHSDPVMVEDSHHSMLATVLGSKAAAADSILYSYKHGFSGFAAKLTPSQAQMMKGHPDVIHMVSNHIFKLHTTRSWDYLGLPLQGSLTQPSSSNNLLAESQMGKDSIIGVIDSGIWPESKSFDDKGMGPVPSRWKGKCIVGDRFKSTNCNKKLIGARWYIKGYLAELGAGNIDALKEDTPDEYLSTRDAFGHGTHTASTAGGSVVGGVSYQGLGGGVARGGAPGARLAIYKACWVQGSCSSADILKAFDDAIHDGVDVLSVSLGRTVPLFNEAELDNGISIGAFHAVANGITVAASAGNEGPGVETVSNTAPWIITVAASTIDRAFPTTITLGNSQTILGQGMIFGKQDIGFTKLKYYPGTLIVGEGGLCKNLPANDSSMAGNIVLCFGLPGDALTNVKNNGGVGVILAVDITIQSCGDVPCVLVDYGIATQMIKYIYSSSSPTVKISPSTTLEGKPLSVKIQPFSSRGPNTLAPEILKPDIAAPGVNILAAYPPPKPLNSSNIMPSGIYQFDSGTSMSCPHVAGIVALLKSLHPSWSPAAIKSALVTTASTTNEWGEPIISKGSFQKIADPFDYGGGIVNPNKAAHPGLVYDMGMSDYIHYLCSMGYKNSDIRRLTTIPIMCPAKTPSKLDVNLPAISIPALRAPVTISRTVTNVGPVNSIYHASVMAPLGVKVSVFPNILVFNSTAKVQSFSVTFSTSHKAQGGYYFGSLTWSDGKHVVRSPIAVKTQIIPSYADFF